MSEPLLWVVTSIYAAVSFNLIMDAKYGLGVCFIGYALANIGLIGSMR